MNRNKNGDETRLALLAAIIDSSDDAILSRSLDDNITSWNRGAERLFGYAAEEILGCAYSLLLHPDHREGMSTVLERIQRGIHKEHDEAIRLKKGGLPIAVSLVESPIRDAHGVIIGISSIARDITDRRRLDEQARATSQYARSPIDASLEPMIAISPDSKVTDVTAQKQASPAAHGSLLTALDEHSLVAITDQRGRITFVNDRFCAISRYSREDLIGRGHRILNSGHHSKEFMRNLWTTIGNGAVWHGEFKNRAKDGSFYWVNATIVPSLDEQGKPRQYIAVLTDITAVRVAEEAKDRLAAIVKSSELAIIGKTMDSIITSWNAAAERLFGYAAHEAIGQSMQLLIPADRRDEEPKILARIAQGESVEHLETIRLTKDGRPVDISIAVSPIRDAGGVVIGASQIAHDITERKRAEAKTKAQLARLHLLHQVARAIDERQDLQSILQVVVRTLEDDLPIDFGCACLYQAETNTLTVSCVGIRSAALAQELALPVNATIPIDQNGMLRCVSGQLVYEPDIHDSAFPFPQRLARGGLRSLVAVPLAIEGKVFAAMIVARHRAHGFSSGDCEFLRQLGEHVALAAHQARLHSALQQAYDDLRQTQQAVMQQERLRALGQLASGIAHDINNALSPTTLYIDNLLDKEISLSDKGRKQLEIIQRAIGDVAHTIDRLGEFYRQGPGQSSPAAVDINELVPQVVDLTRARWSDMALQRGVVIRIQTELEPELAKILGIASEIREALINLVFNAVDAMPQGGTVTIRTLSGAGEDGAKHVELMVVDTGSGMDEETRRRCLEPFFTTKGERGSGLGLPMVYGIAQRHGAKLTISSEVGRGSSISLTFPLPTADHPADLRAQPETQVQSPQRILVVDDDALLLKSLRDCLEDDGHTVFTADHGQAGIDAFRAAYGSERAFTVVFTDLGMPIIDGRAVAAAVKAISPSTPVILLTGWGRRMQTSGDKPPHVDQVLSKPPKAADLRQALAQFIQPRRPEPP